MAGLVGEINKEWAAWVAYQQVDIWQFNRYNAEVIQGDVPLAKLGGLVVTFAKNIVVDEEDAEDFNRHGIVNLAFNEPSLVTSTPELLAAAQETFLEDTQIIKALKKRCGPDSDLGHSGTERWLFPVRALGLKTLVDVHEDN